MLDEEDFKNKYLQQPITFLTEENLDILETHCRRAVNFEKGFEHKVVLELLERYYQFQKEIQDKNNKIAKLQEENEELRKGQNSLMQSRKKWKDRYYKLKAKSRKIIDLMAQNIELQQFANIDITNLDLICKRLHCNKKCRLVSKECIKKYFTRIIRR